MAVRLGGKWLEASEIIILLTVSNPFSAALSFLQPAKSNLLGELQFF
jgi:hypothetical protein